MNMKIFLTIDVECYSGDYESEVWAHGLGLPFILDSLSRHRLHATFFVEGLGIRRWGREPTERICKAIREGGHEVQLHLHPSIAKAWGLVDRYDRLWAYDLATQIDLLRQAKEGLNACVDAPITAFRAGDLAANADTLVAMSANGIHLGSNRDRDSKGSIESHLNDLFPVDGDLSTIPLARLMPSSSETATDSGLASCSSLDLPVSSFSSPLAWLDGPARHLQITAVAAGELLAVLRKMAKAGYRTATILMHPGEFYVRTQDGFAPNHKNRKRLEKVLAALAEADAEVCVCSEIRSGIPIPAVSPPAIRGSLPWALVRIAEQVWWRVRRSPRS